MKSINTGGEIDTENWKQITVTNIYVKQGNISLSVFDLINKNHQQKSHYIRHSDHK
jgi:hypothetical protein